METEQLLGFEAAIESLLLEAIPLSEAMGIQVEEASSARVILRAPLANNINHKQTAFGGSLHAVATLACWSLLHVNLVELLKEHVHIVIASSEIEYLQPVTADFCAEASLPDKQEWEYFLKTLERRKKARVQLRATISLGGSACVTYEGSFVAIRVADNASL
jgi:thioesterase domain-containing protein